MTTSSTCRLAILASHPIQYFTPVYRRLAARSDIRLKVLFYRDFGVRERYDKQFGRALQWNTDQLTGYDHEFLFNVSPIADSFNPLHAINPGVFFRMLAPYDAIWVNGYLYPSNWLGAIAGKLRGARLLLRSELALDRVERSGMRHDIRETLLRKWIKASDALLYIGQENRSAYLRYGADRGKLFFTPYSTDVDRFGDAQLRSPDVRAEIRRRYGIAPNALVLLFAGKLIARKHPEALLRFAGDDSAGVHLVYVGSGEMERHLRQAVLDLRATNVSFLGFVNQTELPSVYAIGDIFVMPSEAEPWGLVLNEAMVSGMAPVVASAVGAAADLIEDHKTGLMFEANDWTSMEQQVRLLMNDKSARMGIAAAARECAMRYSFDATAAGVVEALRAVGVLETSDES